ncbi:MAG: glycosyltransferase [Arenicellales bacterium]|nr:glycosyltransferase [Arenicellales bacterium]
MVQASPKRPPTVSVVMPAYNHERFVGDAIDSVLNQTFSDVELIIIDDGSTDATGTIAQSYSDPRIRYHFQENQDAFNALNRGMGLSTGKYISIINSDDVYTLDRIERLLEIQRETAAACIFSDVIPIDDQGEELTQHPWRSWHEINREYYFKTKDLYDGFLHGNYMVTTSNLFLTRELAETVGEFCPLRYLHDYDYIFRILLAAEDKTIYLDDEKLLYYRIHGGNTLSEAAIIGREQDKKIIRQYLLEKCPPHTHGHINTAIDRLITLEHELTKVHARLNREKQIQARHKLSIPTRIANKLQSLLARS